MLLKSITLKNFRQFKDITLDFSTDNEKNVTIVIGDNGSGKTTLLQAFFWCLYEKESFSDKELFNKENFKSIDINRTIVVEVIIHLIHSNTEYSISRLIEYKKNDIEQAKIVKQEFKIKKKLAEGQWTYLNAIDKVIEVDRILPEDLSKYFFFAGEKIESMSKDLIKGKKNADFKKAVMGLTGLNALIKAREHLDPKKPKSVKSKFVSEYNGSANDEINKLTADIEQFIGKIDGYKNRIEILNKNMEESQNNLENAKIEIKSYDEGRKFQERKEKLEQDFFLQQRIKKNIIDKILLNFQQNRVNFFSSVLVYDALKMISTFDVSGKDIPDISSKTIQYLIEKGECLCGNCLSEDSEAYNNIKELLQYIPPQSIGTVVGNFVNETKRKFVDNNILFENITDEMKHLSLCNNDIAEINDEIFKISKKLSSEEMTIRVKNLQNLIYTCEHTIRKNMDDIANLNRQIGAMESDISIKETKRDKLISNDENNKLIGLCIAYTEAIYELLNNEYKVKEEDIKTKLEKYINDIFQSIFNGEITITIDNDYYIDFIINKYQEGIEISTAQSVSVIFAFIASIMKITRENSITEDEEIIAEPYPLVMDAPWSVFDKERIEAVTKFLPEIAQQVIIFIKDTDGNIATDNLSDKLGKLYRLNKINDFDTSVIGGR